MLFALLGLHAVLAAVAPLLARRLGRAVFLACALPPAATVAWAFSHAGAVFEGRAITATAAWAPSMGVTADLRLDGFSLLMVALVSGIGTLVFVYAYGYFSEPRPDLGSFAGTLIAFAGSMLGLVLADNILLLFVFWELTSITSYLLIGFEDRKPEARAAALQALLTTGAGGLALLGGLVLIGQAAGTYSLSGILAAAPSGAAVNAGLVLALLGAFTKSAQVPFHTWLPGAMAAPTPVSAYLHSATMVKAGVYLVARLAPAFASAPPWRPMVLVVGLVTMFVGAYRALRQHDVKLLLAFGTVSQLGFLIVLFGAGTADMVFAGTVLLLAHGVFKAALFMVVGIVDHEAHSRDLRRLTGLHRVMPTVALTGAITAASMAGLPPLLGFLGKEAAFEALVHGGFGPLSTVTAIGVVAASALSFAYSARFVWGTFAPKRGETPGAGPLLPPEEVHRPPALFAAPAAVLAAVTVAVGVYPATADLLVNRAAMALVPGFEGVPLKLWHGFNVPLALSMVTVAVGSMLFVSRVGIERVQALLPAVPSSRAAYEATVRGLLTTATRTTGIVQNGSLPIYLAVILGTTLALPSWALVRGGAVPIAPDIAAGSAHAAVAGITVAAALATLAARHRFAAVLFLGAVGYGVAVLFVLQGAPDLALTQLLVETLMLVIFVLVLRHLPSSFERAGLRATNVVRTVAAISVGTFVTVFALLAGAARTAPPVSAEYLARAYPEAQGRNVVNVILVDFRALDTLGEITVLVVAALGIASLVQASRLQRRAGDSLPGDGRAPDGAGRSREEVRR